MQSLGHWLALIQCLRSLPSEAGRHIPEDGMFTTSWPNTTAIKAASSNPFLLIYKWAPGRYTFPGRKYCFLREDDLKSLQLLSTHQPCRDFTRSNVTTWRCFSTSPWVYVCLSRSVLSDSCYRMDCSSAGSSMGLSRQEYWNGLPFPSPGHLPNPGDRTCISCIAGRFSAVWAIREGNLKHTVWSPGLTVGPPGLLTNLQWALITSGHFSGCVVWRVELCPLECVAVLTPVPVNATLFENRVFACDQVKMKSWGRALVQSDWLLIKGKFGHRKTSHTGRPPCGN